MVADLHPDNSTSDTDTHHISDIGHTMVNLVVGRHGKRQKIYTSKVCAKIILPEKERKLRQK